MIALGDMAVAVVGLVLVGVGIGMHDTGCALTVVGAVLLLGSLVPRMRRKPPNA